MAVSVTHSTTATLPDEAGAEINKAEWNAAHTVTGLGTMAEQNSTAVSITGGRGIGILLGQSGTAVSGAADTNENILATITIPALAAGDRLFIISHWAVNNNAGAKTARHRLGGIGGTIFGSQNFANTTGGKLMVDIINRATAATQVGWQTTITVSGGIAVLQPTGAIDTSAGTTIVITGQKASGADTITLESYSVEMWRKP